jgi:hypothetical protein
MSRLSQTWSEAAKGRAILLSLQGEYHPVSGDFSQVDATAFPTFNGMENTQDWLAGQDFWGLLFSEQPLGFHEQNQYSSDT